MLIKALRPDRILSATKKFTFALLGEDVLRESELVLDFKKIIENEVSLFKNARIVCKRRIFIIDLVKMQYANVTLLYIGI